MGYVITFSDVEHTTRVCISHARCALKVYRFAKANGYNVTMTRTQPPPMPKRTKEEQSIAQDILSELIDKGLDI